MAPKKLTIRRWGFNFNEGSVLSRHLPVIAVNWGRMRWYVALPLGRRVLRSYRIGV